jgi:hypothetical protein
VAYSGMADKPSDKPAAEQEEESLDTSSQAKVILKDPFVGNVSKLVPLPVDHKGPPMRGHLIFDACFEGGGDQLVVAKATFIYYVQYTDLAIAPCAGNLGRVDYINDYEYDIFIRPDTCNPR